MAEKRLSICAVIRIASTKYHAQIAERVAKFARPSTSFANHPNYWQRYLGTTRADIIWLYSTYQRRTEINPSVNPDWYSSAGGTKEL